MLAKKDYRIYFSGNVNKVLAVFEFIAREIISEYLAYRLSYYICSDTLCLLLSGLVDVLEFQNFLS